MNKNILILFQIIFSTIFRCIICGISPNASIPSTGTVFGNTSVLISRYGNSFPQLREILGGDPMQN